LYDQQFVGSNLLISSGNANGLPQDDYQGKRDRSTGVMVPLQQLPKPITIAGRVFFDADADLVQDAGDTGINSVTLSLWKKVGNSYINTGITRQTNSLGDYEFGADLALQPGTYQVRETQPEDYFSVGAIVGKVEGVTTGDLVSGDLDQLTEIAMPLGDTHGLRYDFAETLPASISGLVRLTDKFGNCEAAGVATRPIQGATVLLKDKQGNILKQTLTNAQGKYEFTGLRPGEYTIIEITPPGLIDGGDHVGTVDGVLTGSVVQNDVIDVSLKGGDDGINYDFCEKEPAMVSGYVYHDRDNDGNRDPGEESIPGTTIILLDASGTQVATQVTNNDGFYKFTGLGAGTYMIVEHQPTGWSDGKDTPGTIGGVTRGTAVNPGDKLNGVQLYYGDNGVEYNFGELKTVSISGFVHEDPIRNCVFDEGERPIASVTIGLYDTAGNLLSTTLTDEHGFYKFDELPPGTYMVRETQPAGYIQGGQKLGSHGGIEATDQLSNVILTSGQNATEYNFCEILPVSINGYVHEDPDRDCFFDNGEKPIAGVTIRLYDQNNTLVATTFTNANGFYKFEGLPPGTYTVREQQPGGYFQGGQVVGSHGGNASTDELSNVTLNSGDNAVNYNFCEILPANLSGWVWVDTQHDCIRQPEELPLAGVTITLYNELGSVVATTQTNNQGFYQFSGLAPGSYTVKESQPTGYFQGGQVAGSKGGDDFTQDEIADVDLEGGDSAVEYNFCEVPPASLSGYVFQDGPPIVTNESTPPDNLYDLKDGLLTDDDIRISGVRLELRHTLTGDPVDLSETLNGGSGAYQITTDSNGFYQFVGLQAGNYTVIEVHPEGYFDSKDTAGTTTGLAVNVNTTVDALTLQTFTLAGVSLNFDAILRIPLAAGQNSLLNNFSEVVITPTIIPPPPKFITPPPPEQFVPPPTPLPPPQLLFIPPPVAEQNITGGDAEYTWHLSVIDAGTPRISARSTRINNSVFRPALFIDKVEWKPDHLHHGIWTIHTGHDDIQSKQFTFGIIGGIPVVGDWNGDGTSELGIFYKGEWFLDLNGNGVWDEGDLWARLGSEADKPVVGDWDGDGKDDIGIFGPEWPMDPRHIEHEPGLPDPHNGPKDRQKNVPPRPEEATEGDRLLQLTKHGKERSDLIDHVFHFGVATAIPIAGDWNGDGIRSIGVFRDGKWHFDLDGDGKWSKGDKTSRFGQKGDLPVVGDFNGDGIEEIGVFRGGRWIIDTNGNHEIDAADRVFELGGEGDLPAVGDWNGDGTDDPGLYREGTGHVPTSFGSGE
jgi:protocatechuate 3,4-dioxygenase beta subunit